MSRDLESIREELQAKKAVLLDVRETEEWAEQHLKYARLVPLSDIERFDIPDEIDKESKIYLHCSTGRRVILAEQFLVGLGFKQVISLGENFEELLMEGL